jgi:hypothetical protein
VPDRLPSPGASHVPEVEVRAGGRVFRAGLTDPTTTDDGWWLTILWVAGAHGLADFADVAPDAGPPPDPPLFRLGPDLAGSLSGMIAEESGRLGIRLAPLVPPSDPARPWRCPLAVRAAFLWEPMRAATMPAGELATTVLAGFGHAVEDLGRR